MLLEKILYRLCDFAGTASSPTHAIEGKVKTTLFAAAFRGVWANHADPRGLNLTSARKIQPSGVSMVCPHCGESKGVDPQQRFALDLACQSDWSLKFIWFPALLGHANGETISHLIKYSADINLQLRVPINEPTLWLFFTVQSKRHLISPSALTRLCYHSHKATPLMFSILAGRFEAASILLKAGACLDLKDARGKTGANLIQEVKADMPMTLNELFQQYLNPNGTNCGRGNAGDFRDESDSNDTIEI